jgi:NAD(P) transhydrogenase subunit alpha
VSFLQPVTDAERVRALADRGATAVSMDAIPRIARAQSMDALSSMSSIGGYKSVLIGAGALGRYLPMMTTAAGTIKAGKVLILGAGVAGLQAIATAGRLGAAVTAFDIRPEVKEQIESLGATFLEEREEQPARSEKESAPSEQEANGDGSSPSGLGAAVAWLKEVFEIGSGQKADAQPAGDADGAGEGNGAAEQEDDSEESSAPGGYAREQAEEKQERDREMIRQHLRDVDLVITTALVPGKRAPVLLTREMVEAMRPGSVVVDLAAEAGGNCELTQPGEVVEHEQVEIHGPDDLPSQMPIDASRLYSRNVVNLLAHLVDDDGALQLDMDDEITDSVCLAHAGEVRSEAAREALSGSAAGSASGGGRGSGS